ncbi:MAG: TlpA family protein disulfide reductase [Chitinophagaceae bacterium]|jgi:thiol-disulfide isomerase/thioredoxin|nr:TlpA family protein disulfide reductase [Chitinophagaceae bacterium]
MKYSIIITVCLLIGCLAQAQSVRKVKITELESVIKQSQRPLVVNFWATYCKPCVEEMPGLVKAAEQYSKDSVQLILVSLDLEEDYPDKVNGFAKRFKVKGMLYWLDEYDADYFCPRVDSAWSGAIPATLFINNKTGYRSFQERALTASQVQLQIATMLAPARSRQ